MFLGDPCESLRAIGHGGLDGFSTYQPKRACCSYCSECPGYARMLKCFGMVICVCVGVTIKSLEICLHVMKLEITCNFRNSY